MQNQPFFDSKRNISSGNDVMAVSSLVPMDANIMNNQMAPYLDQTDGHLKFRIRESTGTLKTGEVAIS